MLLYIHYYFFLASDEEAELAAQEEEEEALTLQKRMASRLDEDDFDAFEQVFRILNSLRQVIFPSLFFSVLGFRFCPQKETHIIRNS